MEFSSRSEHFLACPMDLNTKNRNCKFNRSFCIKRSIMKHLEFFDLKIFSGLWNGPDSINFFFLLLWVLIFSPRNWFYLMYPSNKTAAAAAAKSLQSCLTLCDPTDGSPPGSSVPGILQARILEWAAISFSNAWKWKVKVKSLSHARLLVTPWTTAYQAPPSMQFSRQEYWSGMSLPSPTQVLSFSVKKKISIKKKEIIWSSK